MITDPASIAWLLNIRGGDVPFTPFALGFALLHADGGDASCSWTRPSCRRRRGRGSATRVSRGRTARRCRRRWRALSGQARAGGSGRLAGLVRADACARRAPRWSAGTDPCLLPKACKNAVEQQGARNAHRARCRRRLPVPALAARRGRAARDRDVARRPSCSSSASEVAGFRGESFPAISGAGEHGAIIHYRVSRGDRPADPRRRGLS